jgi:hypothetical protein
MQQEHHRGVNVTDDSELLLQFENDTGELAVVIEDDGRVAYAYLLEHGKVVADVWLYNVAAAPESVDWADRAAMPFLNPRAYCGARTIPRFGTDTQLTCKWDARGVVILVDDDAVAQLTVGERPGRSRGAEQAGPLARPLAEG